MKLQTKYKFLKGTTIVLGALSIPWGTFAGFCFGDGRYVTGLISLFTQTVVALVDGYIWCWVLEKMTNRIQEETIKEPIKDIKESRVACPLFLKSNGSRASFPKGFDDHWPWDTVTSVNARSEKSNGEWTSQKYQTIS